MQNYTNFDAIEYFYASMALIFYETNVFKLSEGGREFWNVFDDEFSHNRGIMYLIF